MYTLAKLSGTPKQIKWAESIRAAYVTALMADNEADKDARAAFISGLTNESKDWIDGRFRRFVPTNFETALSREKQIEEDRRFARDADEYERWYGSQYGQY